MRLPLIKALVAAPKLVLAAIKAWSTLEPSDWRRVASNFKALRFAFPKSGLLALTEARLLRASRQLNEAIAAGLVARDLSPHDTGVLLELARAFRANGQREEAIAALVQAAEAGSTAATRALVRYGARTHMPKREDGIFARTEYSAFAHAHQPPPPPSSKRNIHFRVTLAGTAAEQAASLACLQQQSHSDWSIGVPAHPDTLNLSLPAGAQLCPHTLGWLAWAAAETDAAIVRFDYDYVTKDGARCDPVLLPPHPDRLWHGGPPGSPLIEAVGQNHDEGKAVHVPLVLASLPFETPRPAAAPTEHTGAEPLRLSVIVPTRDNPALLREAIETLLATASCPENIEVIVVDNDSRTPEAKAVFTTLAMRTGTHILSFPEAFNWSRANNLGARMAQGNALLFMNDDTAMQTPDWDKILADLLVRDDVGVVGARLLYPDGRYQHAGFVLGMDNGPQHEARWMPGEDPGPGGRWIATREAAGVTGAFIAIRRDRFETLGGFDEVNLPIDFADLDLCFKARRAGWAVAYAGAITLTHHESVSRGLNLSRAKRRHMECERAAFQQRWGNWITKDPFYHPMWVRTGCSYDGLRALTTEEVEITCRATNVLQSAT